MFRAFLKVADHCSACGEALHHQRADDAPAYFVILIVGHFIVPAALSIEISYAPSYWIHAALWLPSAIGLSLLLLQPIKGVLVGLQWALRMHGFNPAEGSNALAPNPIVEPHR